MTLNQEITLILKLIDLNKYPNNQILIQLKLYHPINQLNKHLEKVKDCILHIVAIKTIPYSTNRIN